MKAENRTRNLFTLLGWQGGTIHDACKEIGVDPHDFLYASADFNDNDPCIDFRRGYDEVKAPSFSNRGCLQYWLGAISAVQNNRGANRNG